MLSSFVQLLSLVRWWAPLVAAGLLIGAPASAVTIAYDISSSGELGTFPFSGVFAHDDDDDDDRKKRDDDRRKHDDDDWDRDDRKKHYDDDDDDRHKGKKKGHYKHHKNRKGKGHHEKKDHDDDRGQGGGKGDVSILSNDLRGLIVLSTHDDTLFLEEQELTVETFSLMGTLAFCYDCEELALTIELDPDSESILEFEDGFLEGEIELLVTIDKGGEKRLTLRVEGETEDEEWNFATPDVLSLLLEIELDDDDWGGPYDSCKGGSKSGYKGSYGDDHKGGDDCDRFEEVFLKAQGTVVPEPGTALLLGTGLLALAAASRRRL